MLMPFEKVEVAVEVTFSARASVVEALEIAKSDEVALKLLSVEVPIEKVPSLLVMSQFLALVPALVSESAKYGVPEEMVMSQGLVVVPSAI
jgi:hypothetical protein